MDLDRLSDTFPVSAIRWRVGSTHSDNTVGMGLAYINARDVMDRLDDVCGVTNWQTRYPFPGCCEIGIRLDNEWIWKSNGAGETQFEAEKGQFSDAFKRAAVLWGIGRYLYDSPTIWVEIQQRGKSYNFTKKGLEDLKTCFSAWLENTHRFKPGEKEEIYKQIKAALDSGDSVGVKQVLDEYDGPETKMKIWALFNSSERACIKELLK